MAFNVRILSNPVFRGWNRYTINLITQIADLGARVFLYTDRPLDPAQAAQLPLQGVTVRQSPAMNYVAWEQGWLARQCRLDDVDIFHCPVHFGMPQLTGAKCILTLHDAIDEVYYGPKLTRPSISQRITSSLGAMARRRADYIVTVSDHSRNDIIRQFGVDPWRISSVHLAAEERFQKVDAARIAGVRSEYALPSKYLFYIGSLEPRKRMSFVLEAMARLRSSGLQLAVAGGSAADRASFEGQALALGLRDKVTLLGHIHDRDLPALYAGAEGFVYPSEYEGFGLQLCEAMATGCPILAARATCFPEVLGPGGYTFSPSDPSDLAGALHRLETDPAFEQDLRRRARERSRVFSWKRTAEETLAVYETALRFPEKKRFGRKGPVVASGKADRSWAVTSANVSGRMQSAPERGALGD